MKESIGTKVKDMLKSWKVILLIMFLLISYVTILGFNSFDAKEGVVINGISINSAAERAGISYTSSTSLMSLEQISSVDGKEVSTVEDFYNLVDAKDKNSTIIIKTNLNEEGYNIDLNSENQNETSRQTLGISVRERPSSNIKLGIELEGGSRLILKPQTEISSEQFDMLISSLQNRLDIYGASGTKVNKLEDSYTGEKFVIVESSSSNKNDVFDLIKRQGNFEAKVGNVSVFTGENIVNVFTDAQRSRLEGCRNVEGNKVMCSYLFQIGIDEEGTDSFFDATSKLDVTSGGSLSEKVTFYLDGREITSLSIAKDFKYKKISSPTITVSSEAMLTREDAIEGGKKEMKLLQTILSTDSLPSELEVVQSYSISSTVGQTLLDNAMWVGLFSVLMVAGIVALRYRHFGIFIGIMIALLGEVFIVFGIAAFMRLTIDLSAIGGLIAAIGTGVDDQIIITDEYFTKNKNKEKLRSKQKIKNAFYIIMIAYFTTLAAMIPLMFAGLKMLQGFSFMILIGVTVGVLITRPAYASMLRIMMTTKKQREIEKKEEEEEDN